MTVEINPFQSPDTDVMTPSASVEPIHEGALEPTREQLRYAGVLEKGRRVGLACLLVSFPLYILGFVEPHVPIEQLQQCWTLSVHEYCDQTGVEPGWKWLSLAGRGDYMNLVGIAVLASVTAVCYLTVIPLMLRRKDFVYAVLAVLQIAILVLAASGILTAGH
jgi:hypothetical protein